MDIWQFFWSHCLGVKERERKEKGNVEYNFTSKREREREREKERVGEERPNVKKLEIAFSNFL